MRGLGPSANLTFLFTSKNPRLVSLPNTEKHNKSTAEQVNSTYMPKETNLLLKRVRWKWIASCCSTFGAPENGEFKYFGPANSSAILRFSFHCGGNIVARAHFLNVAPFCHERKICYRHKFCVLDTKKRRAQQCCHVLPGLATSKVTMLLPQCVLVLPGPK